MPNVHKDTHFDSAVSNIDSANSPQKASVGGKVFQVLFLVLPVFQSYVGKAICGCENYCFGPLLQLLTCCKQPEVTKKRKDEGFLTFRYSCIPRMRLPTPWSMLTVSGRSSALSESLRGISEIKAAFLYPESIRTHCTVKILCNSS